MPDEYFDIARVQDNGGVCPHCKSRWGHHDNCELFHVDKADFPKVAMTEELLSHVDRVLARRSRKTEG
jgi:hypothetical protein